MDIKYLEQYRQQMIDRMSKYGDTNNDILEFEFEVIPTWWERLKIKLGFMKLCDCKHWLQIRSNIMNTLENTPTH